MAKNSVYAIVIGAGVAGLSAARTLQKAGKSVIVLESRDRIGGRLWTDRKWEDTPMDMGAGWIEGIEENPVAEFAKKNKIKMTLSDDDNVVLYDLHGEEVSDEEFDALDDDYDKMMDAIDEKREKLKEDVSLGSLIEDYMDEMDFSDKERMKMRFYVSNTIESDYAADCSELSGKYWDSDDGFDGEDVIFLNGFDEVAQNLARNLDIRLEHIVEKISYDEGGVTVETDQGKFTGEIAVVTLPLGVLKKGTVEFEPSLPKRKQKAIDNLNMGVLDRLYLKFPKAFWSKEPELIHHYAKEKKDDLDIMNFYHFTDKPILLFFTSGNDALEKEAFSDKEIIKHAMKSLQKIYGKDIPEPIDYLRKSWGEDKFVYGSYSYIPVGASGDDHDILAESVDDVLFFAGEATTSDYSGTIVGAFISGQDAAEEILS